MRIWGLTPRVEEFPVEEFGRSSDLPGSGDSDFRDATETFLHWEHLNG